MEDRMSAVMQPGDAPPAAGKAHGARRPWGWIALAAVLLAAAIGHGIYALQLNSDLDDADATIAKQEQALSAQDTGGQALDAIGAAVGEVTSALGATQADVTALEQQVAAAADRLEEAEGKVAAAADQVERTEAERDAAQAKVDVVQACAQSVVSAFDGVFEAESLRAGVEAAASELRALQPQCGPPISGS
jgi:chromosome segregation ATPase